PCRMVLPVKGSLRRCWRSALDRSGPFVRTSLYGGRLHLASPSRHSDSVLQENELNKDSNHFSFSDRAARPASLGTLDHVKFSWIQLIPCLLAGGFTLTQTSWLASVPDQANVCLATLTRWPIFGGHFRFPVVVAESVLAIFVSTKRSVRGSAGKSLFPVDKFLSCMSPNRPWEG